MSKFYLVAWEGEPLTWSVVSEKFVRDETGATAGEARQARWDEERVSLLIIHFVLSTNVYLDTKKELCEGSDLFINAWSEFEKRGGEKLV